MHEVARGFNDPRLAADLASKMEDGSFQKDVVVEMLMMVTMSSVFEGGLANGEINIPFEKPPLTRRTVKAVFEGIVNLRTWDGRDGEWGKAERRVVDFLRREWMTIVSGDGVRSGFSGWRPAMLTVLSRKLRVSVDDLLGKGDLGNNNKKMVVVGGVVAVAVVGGGELSIGVATTVAAMARRVRMKVQGCIFGRLWSWFLGQRDGWASSWCWVGSRLLAAVESRMKMIRGRK